MFIWLKKLFTKTSSNDVVREPDPPQHTIVYKDLIDQSVRITYTVKEDDRSIATLELATRTGTVINMVGSNLRWLTDRQVGVLETARLLYDQDPESQVNKGLLSDSAWEALLMSGILDIWIPTTAVADKNHNVTITFYAFPEVRLHIALQQARAVMSIPLLAQDVVAGIHRLSYSSFRKSFPDLPQYVSFNVEAVGEWSMSDSQGLITPLTSEQTWMLLVRACGVGGLVQYLKDAGLVRKDNPNWVDGRHRIVLESGRILFLDPSLEVLTEL